MFKKSLSIAALVVCAAALAGNASANVFASDLVVTSVDENQCNVTFTLNQDATSVQLVVLDSTDTAIKTADLGAMTAGSGKTASWDLTKDDNTKAPAGEYSWQIIATGAAIAEST